MVWHAVHDEQHDRENADDNDGNCCALDNVCVGNSGDREIDGSDENDAPEDAPPYLKNAVRQMP